MKISAAITDLLKKELSYTQFAVQKLQEEALYYEKKHSMSSREFMDQFQAGKIGDDRAWFDWYGLMASIKDWNETKKEITQTIRTA